MVIISASIISKSGKIVMSRQFLEISKANIQSKLKYFHERVNTNMDQSYIEDENSRYIFLPIDELYLTLITDKESNLIDDFNTLRRLCEIVRFFCQYDFSIIRIQKLVVNIVMAFDDFICMGYSNPCHLIEIISNVLMESAEEKDFRETIQVNIN